MTDLETKQQKIIVAVFLLLGKAYSLLNVREREKVSCLESEIAKAWQEKKSPVRVISEAQPAYFSPVTEYEQWGGERRYSVMIGDLDLSKVSKGFASVPMPKSDPTGIVTEEKEKSRVFQLE